MLSFKPASCITLNRHAVSDACGHSQHCVRYGNRRRNQRNVRHVRSHNGDRTHSRDSRRHNIRNRGCPDWTSSLSITIKSLSWRFNPEAGVVPPELFLSFTLEEVLL